MPLLREDWIDGARDGGRASGGRGRDDGDWRGRDSSGASGGDDGWLGLTEEPLDGLAFRAVTELASELEYSGGAERRQADATTATVNLGGAVLGGASGGGRFSGDGEFRFGIGGGASGGGGGGDCGGGGVRKWVNN